MARYPSYQPTDIPWLPEIPEGWEVRRCASLLKVKESISAPKAELLSVFLDRGVIKFSEGGEKRANATSKDLTKYQEVCPGEFVMNNQQAWRGSVGISPYYGIISPAYIVTTISKSLNVQYANLLLRSKLVVGLYEVCSRGVGSIQRNLIWNLFKGKSLPVPPLAEQERIVAYLDKQTLKIDKLVAAKTKQIALLKELRERTIADAVTRGLPGEHTSFLSTNIPWLPEIPVGWEVKGLRHFLTVVSLRGCPERQLLSVTRERGVIIRDIESKEENHNFIPEDLSNYKVVEAGDFVVNKMKSWQGSYGLSRYDGIVSPAYYVFKIREVNGIFFSVAIRSKTYISFFARYSKGIRSGQWDLPIEAIKEIPFALPPLSEQERIVAYLDEQTAKIDKAVALLASGIERLKEYRERLIADVVTGQQKVE